jgi:hypothetical protein
MSRLRAEGASIGFELGRAGSIAASEIARDYVRARSAAQSYARRWLALAQGETRAEAAKAASVATKGSITRIGVTESSEAFNSGRAKYLRTARGLTLLRVWDARNDHRTCSICSGLDGMIVGIRESFPHGEPGAVHPFDRCNFSILTAAEAGDFTLIQAA